MLIGKSPGASTIYLRGSTHKGGWMVVLCWASQSARRRHPATLSIVLLYNTLPLYFLPALSRLPPLSFLLQSSRLLFMWCLLFAGIAVQTGIGTRCH